MSEQWYFAKDGQQQGPVNRQELRSRGIDRSTLVWQEGMSDWQPASEVPQLADLFAAPPAYRPTGGPLGHSESQPPAQPAPTSAGPLGYHSTQPYPGGQPTKTNGLAIASMVLGIIGIPATCAYGLGLVPSILAIIFGHIAKSQIRTTGEQGEGMATAGLVMGYIMLGILALMILFVVFIGIGAALA